MESPRPGKVVLIGYRAAGKTTVGRLLAARLGWSYVDVDRGIEEHCRLTIREIIERHGEPFYRDLESEVVVVLCAGAERVVAFGAGTPMRARNREHARRDSLVVYLETHAAELWRRIEADPGSAATRPNLAGGGLPEVIAMLGQRAPVYQKLADLTLDATQRPAQLAAAIVGTVRQPGG